MLRRAFVLCLWLTATAVAMPARATGLESDDYYLIRDFDLVAFGREFAYVEDPRVLKWDGPIRFFIAERHPIPADDMAFLRKHILDLYEISGVEMSYVDRLSEANFAILFVSEHDFPQTVKSHIAGDAKLADYLVDHANCLAVFGTNANHALDVVTVIIPVDKVSKTEGGLRRCILEETTQSMGLINDSPEVGPSLFNNSGPRVVEFNYHDRTLLKLLYHPRLEAGMKRLDALEVAREILHEVR